MLIQQFRLKDISIFQLKDNLKFIQPTPAEITLLSPKPENYRILL